MRERFDFEIDEEPVQRRPTQLNILDLFTVLALLASGLLAASKCSPPSMAAASPPWMSILMKWTGSAPIPARLHTSSWCGAGSAPFLQRRAHLVSLGRSEPWRGGGSRFEEKGSRFTVFPVPSASLLVPALIPHSMRAC